MRKVNLICLFLGHAPSKDATKCERCGIAMDPNSCESCRRVHWCYSFNGQSTDSIEECMTGNMKFHTREK